MMLAGSFFALLMCGCNPHSPAPSARCPAGTSDATLVSGGQTREYRIVVPRAYRTGKSIPLVLGFHGNGSTAAQFESYSGFSTLAQREGFIAVYPQGLGDIPGWDAWAGSKDVQFVRDLIGSIETECEIDPSRIYAVGHSRGGGMANRLACDVSDRVAAIGSVSGVYPSGEDCSPSRPVGIVAFHGTDDSIVPYNGIGSGIREVYFTIGTPIPQWASAWAERNGCDSKPAAVFQQGTVTGSEWNYCRAGGDVILYTVSGGGHEWPGAVDTAAMIWEFFTNHPFPSTEK